LGVDDVQALLKKVKQGVETNKEGLMFTKSARSSKLRVRMRLVVATKLQVQHSSFWLRTSSNTPSVMMNDTQGSLLILMRECAFHLITFVLRSAWMNRHNSRQGCNLDELIN
jgi:hypothetical protein